MLSSKFFTHKVIPPVVILSSTALSYALVVLGNSDLELATDFRRVFFSLGSKFAWKITLTFYLWAYLSLILYRRNAIRVPSNEYAPQYSPNGVIYYLLTTIVLFLYAYFFDPYFCIKIYQDFGSFVTVFNLSALIFVSVLTVKGIFNPNSSDDPAQHDTNRYSFLYTFYHGIELNPKILGIDVKQWTNCRVGMMSWALLVCTFTIANFQLNGFQPGAFVTALLICLHLFKCFYWESGYFKTFDITANKVGYYSCWSCLCWVQCFYTFSSYFMVSKPSTHESYHEASVILIMGLLSLLLNYLADRQKEIFKQSNGKCFVWGRLAKKINVEYMDQNGKTRKSCLLVSGYWGICRYINYVFEIFLALSWTLPAIRDSPLPLIYFFYLIILLVQRTYKDDKQYSQKYGEGWEKYKKAVPYKMIPFVF